MTLAGIVARYAQLTTLTEADMEAIGKLSPQDAALLMRSYEDDGKVSDRGFWGNVANDLIQAGQYTWIATVLFAAIPLL